MTLKELETITGTELSYVLQEGEVFTVQLHHTEIKDGAGLISAYGRGPTKFSAEKDYVEQLRGNLIVVGSHSIDRRTYKVPKTLKVK
jgi:radical SAM superfamily enzyme